MHDDEFWDRAFLTALTAFLPMIKSGSAACEASKVLADEAFHVRAAAREVRRMQAERDERESLKGPRTAILNAIGEATRGLTADELLDAAGALTGERGSFERALYLLVADDQIEVHHDKTGTALFCENDCPFFRPTW